MLSGDDNENSQKKVGLISKKYSVARFSSTFLWRCFARLQRVNLSETSQLNVLWRKCCICQFLFTVFFFTATHFHLGGRQHFSFSKQRKIFMLFLQRHWSPLFFVSLSNSFPVIHLNVQTLKLSRKKEWVLFLLFSS